MSVNLDKLFDQKDPQELQKFVRETSTEELVKLVCSRICSFSISNILDEILQVCSETECLYSKRLKLVEAVLRTLCKTDVRFNHANSIVNTIVVDFPKYPKSHLIALVEFCLASIHNNDDDFRSWKDLLPDLLEVLEEEKHISYRNEEISGSKYKSLIVNNICNSEWSMEIMPSLARMFRDISMEEDDRTMVVTVLCTKLQNVSLDELPPLVHQLIRLCNNRDSKYLLEGLRRYFAQCLTQVNYEDNVDIIDGMAVKQFHEVESTVLHHIYQAAQLNHRHVKDYTRYFKIISCAPEAILEPFTLSLLLTVALVCENEIFEMLRVVISKRNEYDDRQRNSAWLRKLVPDCRSIMDVMHYVINTRNRHLVLKGLVDLAFVLMSTEYKSKTDTHPLWQIGASVLRQILAVCRETTVIVFQTLIDKIITGGLYVSQYIDVFKRMCYDLRLFVSEYEDSVITFLDQISSIPGEVAILVVSAMLPFIFASVNIREHSILTLRKILYRKGTSNRQMAVSGILEILIYLKTHSSKGLAMNSSQSLSSSSCATGASSTSILTQVMLERDAQGSTSEYNRILYHDMLGMLQKCFTHEYEVRLHLYSGLCDIALKNTEITEHILEMLLSHFKIYFEADENISVPFKLELCIDIRGEQAVLQEPLAELIFTLQKIYVKSALMKSLLIDELAIILESLCKRMPQIDIENLNLDDKFDLNNSNIKIQEKSQNVLLMIKIYEVLMSFRIDAWSINCTDNAQNVKNLLKGYTRLVEFTKQIPKTKKGASKNRKRNNTNNSIIKKSNRSSNTKLSYSIMELSTVCKSLSLFYLRSVPWTTANQVTILADYHDFYHYVLRTLFHILQNVKLLTAYDLKKHRVQHMKTYFEIGKLLYNHIVLNLKDALDTSEQGTILALECFKELCCLICTCFISEQQKFLDIIISNGTDQAENSNAQLENVISVLRSSFETCFIEKEKYEENSRKIYCVLLDIIYQLTREINFCKTNHDKVFDWIMNFTKLEDMDPQASLIIFRILLCIEERSKEYGELLIDIALALCEKVGNIDKAEMSINNKFKIIHEDTAVQLYNIMNNSIKEKLENVSWLLERLKAKQNITASNTEPVQEDLVMQEERSLCRQLSHIIQILYTLANVSIKSGQATDFMFKNLQYLYHLLNNLTKYFYRKSSKQNAAFQSVKFIQVIQSAGKPLKSAFYNLVTHIEASQTAAKSKTDSYVRRNKILRETKVIPRVVYEIEQFHKEILLLDKKTGVPLESYIKHSITRDFRIKNTQLTEALEKMNISLLNTPHNDTSVSDANTNISSAELSMGPSSPKRPRKTLKT